VAERFFDTNIIVYLLSADERKAQIARDLIEQGGTISVQVLGEFTNVARRKAGLPLNEISETTGLLRELLAVVPMTEEIFETSLEVARKTGYATFDSMSKAERKHFSPKTCSPAESLWGYDWSIHSL